MALQRQLIPPFRYAIVEDSFFRGAYPTIKNFRFLRRLHLKTLVSLTPEAHPNRDMKEFCEHEGITVHNFFVEKFQGDGVTLTTAKVTQVLQIIIRPENLPVYVHCLDGTHVTGVLVMCFRKLQSWNLSTSTAEFCQFEKDGEISREESQFVESFRGEIEVPPAIPKWLWQGIRTVKHPSFRLRLLPAPDGGRGSSAPGAGPDDRQNSSPANLTTRPRYHPSGANNPMDSHAASNRQGMDSHPANQPAGLGSSSPAPIGMTEGAVIYGDRVSGHLQSGSRIRHMGVWLGTDPAGVDELVSKRGGVVVKAPPILALDRTERWSGPQAIVGFPRKGFQDVHDSESRRSLEALSLEGVDVLGSRRGPGWPRQVRRPRSIVGTTPSKSTSSREQDSVLQFISTRR